MLHHAVNGKTDEDALAALAGDGGENLTPVPEGEEAAEASPPHERQDAFVLDQRLPVIQSVLEFAKAKLWMPEVSVWRALTLPRKLLLPPQA